MVTILIAVAFLSMIPAILCPLWLYVIVRYIGKLDRSLSYIQDGQEPE